MATLKICKKCCIEKLLEDFPTHSKKENKIFYRTLCKICDRAYRLDYRANNLKLKEYHKIYKKKYCKNNKEKIMLYQKEYLRKSRFLNPSRKIRENISRSINYHLKKINSSKMGDSIKKYLDYSVKELKEHLEKQFEPWMNWSNYGNYVASKWDDNDSSTWTWQIDHIIPHSTFNYASMADDNFKKCWSLQNLRPLSSKQNILDGLIKTRHGLDR